MQHAEIRNRITSITWTRVGVVSELVARLTGAEVAVIRIDAVLRALSVVVQALVHSATTCHCFQ